MEIKYQKVLNNNPVITPAGNMATGDGYLFKLEPLTIDDIVNLEAAYNNGDPFPLSLRELLFLAGKDCYVLDYGLNDTQEEMQDDVRDCLIEYGFNDLITRPFFVIDVHRGSGLFLFVYLDETINDPTVYQADLDKNLVSDYPRIMSLEAKLSSFVNNRISELLKGYNPF